MPHPELEVAGKKAQEARRMYCGSIGVEFMHLPFPDRCRWIQERMESEPPPVDRARVLEMLVRADTLERTIQSTYVGNKRFSLEGNEALIPLLDELLESAAAKGGDTAMIGMSHRGRLNVMVQIVGKDPVGIFSRFEDVDPRSVLGSGDVKYHLGATGVHETRSGRKMHVHLASNPSHLEAVMPVVLGRTRAKQARIGEEGPRRIVPILLHGDAAFAGQGIVAESLNLAGVAGFDVGGTLHVLVNNLIGFTTSFPSLHGSRFASDVAKRNSIPIFHVNGLDPDAAVRVARMAAEYRYEFASDVVIDLIGFRRHGHSEVDDPTATQPALYRKIESMPPLWRSYGDGASVAGRVGEELLEAKKRAGRLREQPPLFELPEYWISYFGGPHSAADEVETSVPRETLERLGTRLTHLPSGFAVHPKVGKLLDQRRGMVSGERPVDWGMAEHLAFATVMAEGKRVRMSGQDSRRGTFGHRHSVLIDVETEREYCPLTALGPFEIYDSVLSEAAVLGFEYGFSRETPDGLVLWEAQFGDFANGAEIVIDQFVAAGEDKWKLLSGIVLLLPHGFEGQGPEHSSARLERFLQLAAEDNIQVAQPSTAGQYFHLLRRQALRRWRKPLVVLTPKSMLRHPGTTLPIGELASGSFRPVLSDEDHLDASRVLICSGKIGHELREERKKRKERVAILMLEQLYPWPESEMRRALERCESAREIVWVQEEPANMGGLSFAVPRLEHLARNVPVRSIKRSASASPATGSAKAHALEQATLLSMALGTGATKVRGKS